MKTKFSNIALLLITAFRTINSFTFLSSNNAPRFISPIQSKTDTKLFYLKDEATTHVALECTKKVADESRDNFVDPMEEAFDNMQHPMEFMLLNRACIPYVAI